MVSRIQKAPEKIVKSSSHEGWSREQKAMAAAAEKYESENECQALLNGEQSSCWVQNKFGTTSSPKEEAP